MAKLYFRYGAMNSGKSTALMQVAHNYEEQGMHTEYTVTAHFREDGRDLLGLLSRIFMRDTADYSFDSEGYDED